MKKEIMKTVAIIACCLSAALQAVNADPILTFNVGPMDNPMMWQENGTPNGDNEHKFEGTRSDPMNTWMMTFSVTANEDPYIIQDISFQNTSGTTQTYILSSSIAVIPVLPSSLMAGSFGGSIQDDGDGNAVMSTFNGNPIYNGLIDGTGVLPIYPDPTSFSASFAGENVDIPSQNVGLPGPSIPGPAVNSTIGITHIFTLTPDDAVSFTSRFEVIPEPAAAGLMLLISGGIYFTRRFFLS